MKNSIKTIARIGGVLYLIIIITGIFGELFVRGRLIVHGDATATATNIASSQLLWRIGVAGDIFMHVCDVGVTLILYILLKPVNKNLALLAMLFTLVQTAVLVATKLNLFMPLFLLENANYLKAFDPRDLQALSYVSIRMDGYGFGVGLLFFGFACLFLGYLIRQSGFFPRFIGILMQIAGLCYITDSSALIVAPKFADAIFPAILLPCFIGELSLCLWLIIKGVNVARWQEKAIATANTA